MQYDPATVYELALIYFDKDLVLHQFFSSFANITPNTKLDRNVIERYRVRSRKLSSFMFDRSVVSDETLS